MKLKGSYFEFAMPINEIEIKENVFQAHCHDGNGKGYMYLLGIEKGEPCKFTLSEKDFKILSRFPEMDLKVKKDILEVKSGNVKLKLASMVEHLTYIPDFEGMEKLNVAYKDLYRAKSFTGNDAVKIQANGVTVHDDTIIASDRIMLFEIDNLSTGLKKPINIPKEVFKKVPLSDEIEIFANDKGARFTLPGGYGFFYTNLLVQQLPKGMKNQFNSTLKGIEFKASKKDIIGNLKQIQEIDFEGNVDFCFDAENKKIMMKGIRQEGDIQIELDCEIKKIEKDATLVYNINKLITVLNATDKEKIEVEAGEKSLFVIKRDAFIALCPTQRTPGGAK